MWQLVGHKLAGLSHSGGIGTIHDQHQTVLFTWEKVISTQFWVPFQGPLSIKYYDLVYKLRALAKNVHVIEHNSCTEHYAVVSVKFWD